MQFGMLGIKEAAEFIGVSVDTMRRWDNAGLLQSERSEAGQHRFYSLALLEQFVIKRNMSFAVKWLYSKKAYKPNSLFYCPDSSVFQGRLYSLSNDLVKLPDGNFDMPLLLASVGEIGDNAFGHNIGNWPDVPGLFFSFDPSKRTIVLADRGRGLKATLLKIRPNIADDSQALEIAFTEIVSGRAPESRGNGLKFVRSNVEKLGWHLFFQSGDAELKINNSARNKFAIKKSNRPFRGCLAIIRF